MKIGAGTIVWVVIDNDGIVKGVWNSLYHAEKQAERLKLDIKNNIHKSTYLGGV